MIEKSTSIRLVLPIRTVSELNSHEHWRKRQRRAKEQRGIACMLTRARWMLAKPPPKPPWLVTLYRIAPRKLDSDNLAGALKHVRDGIADAMRIDDGDERVTWAYGQRKLLARYAEHVSLAEWGYGVEVRIESVVIQNAAGAK